MRGGANRKPRRLKVIQGTDRPSRRTADPPKPRTGASCPAWLGEEARKEWRRLAPELTRLGLLTGLDAAAFALYCSAWATFVEVERQLAEEGLVIPGHRGVLRKHPLVAVANQTAGALLLLCREFGLTPSSRGRMDIAPPEDQGRDDPLAEFLGRADRPRHGRSDDE